MSTQAPKPARTFVFIEDSPDLLASWEDILSLDGHRFFGFTHGKAALNDRAAIASCDLVVCDFYLPDINGSELAQRVREIRKDVPILFLTGSKEQAVGERLRRLENASVLYKPLKIEQFEAAVDAILHR